MKPVRDTVSLGYLWLKHPNSRSVRFDPILVQGKPQNDYLYKTAVSSRRLRFRQPGDVVYAQTIRRLFNKGS